MLAMLPLPEPVSVRPNVAPVIVPVFVRLRIPLLEERVVARGESEQSAVIVGSAHVDERAVLSAGARFL